MGKQQSDVYTNSIELVVVSDGRVDLGQKEASLTAAVITINVSRHGEPRLEDLHSEEDEEHSEVEAQHSEVDAQHSEEAQQ